MYKIAIMCVCILLSVVPQVSAQENNDADKTNLSARFIPVADNFLTTVQPERLGKDTKETTIYSRGKKFYYQPAVIPEWKNYRKKVVDVCGVTNEKKFLDSFGANLRISLRSEQLEKDIKKEMIKQKIPEFTNNTKLYYIPYDFVRIVLNKNERNHVLYPKEKSYLRFLSDVYRQPKENSIARSITIKINDFCSGHLENLTAVDDGNEELITADLYRIDQKYDTTSLHMAVALGLDEQVKLELFSDESQHISVTSKSNANAEGKSKAMSFNIPFVDKFGVSGKGSGDGKAQINASRIVTRDVLDSLIQKVIVSKKASCQGRDCAALLKATLPTMLGVNFETVLLARTGSAYVVGSAQLGYVTITDSKVKGKIDTAFRSEGEDQKIRNVEIAENGSAAMTDMKKAIADFKGAGEIDATFPIATIANVTILSKDRINLNVDIAISQDIPVDGSVEAIRIPFIYPALHIASGLSLTEAEAKDRALFGKQCAQGKLTKRKNYSAKPKSFRARSPSGSTIAHATGPLPGHYIQSYKLVPTTAPHQHPKSTLNLVTLFALGKRSIKVKGMIKSIKATFSCFRGSKTVGRRTCWAKGYIQTIQQPIGCAPFRLKAQYEAAVGD